MAKATKPIPDGFHTVTPYLTVKGAEKAIEFYKKAFGAKEMVRMPGPGGKVMHAEIQIGDSRVMLGEEAPEMCPVTSATTLSGPPFSIMLYVPDVDAQFKQAVGAGAKVEMPPQDMFWGDRFGKLVDPFGHHWGVATHKEDLTPEEIKRRQAAFFAEMSQQGAKAKA